MSKRKNILIFFCILGFEFFLLPDRFAPALGQSGHSTDLGQEYY